MRRDETQARPYIAASPDAESLFSRDAARFTPSTPLFAAPSDQEKAYLAAGRNQPLTSERAQAAGIWMAQTFETALHQHNEAFDAGRSPSPGASTGRAAAPGGREHAFSGNAGSVRNGGAEEARSAERTFMGGGAPGAGLANDTADGKKKGDSVASSPESELSEEEQKQVREMKTRDKEVRTHEQAHMSAGGSLVRGGATYQRERGPDGAMYAVGGEVQIDTSEASSPEATIAKAQRIKAAALAPAQPSGQDRQVAAQASQMETEARAEKNKKSNEKAGAAGEEDAAVSETQQDAGGASPVPSSNRSSLTLQANKAYARQTGATSLAFSSGSQNAWAV